MDDDDRILFLGVLGLSGSWKRFPLRSRSDCYGVYNSVLFAIGNNHAGTYYPVAQEALCFILQVALHGNSEISRNCAINILWELFFFVPENGADELEEIVKREIANHKDEFLKLSYIDNKNSILLNEFVETISEIQSKNEHRR